MAAPRPRARSSIDGIQRHRANHIHDSVPTYHRNRRRLVLLMLAAVGVLAMTWIVSTVWPLRPLVSLYRPGTYLVLLENDAELRPTGGFIGSYAVVTVRPNRTVTYQVQTNIYKIDNPFTATTAIEPPQPLKGITERWSLRDSNWDIDFPAASQTIQRFYQLETGQTVDGVIAVTAKAGKSLLGSIGSVSLKDGTVIADNAEFYNVLAYKVEKEYFIDPANRAANEPKQLLADLLPVVAHRLSNPVNDWNVSRWLIRMLETKQIVLSFNDDRQSIVEVAGWADRINTNTKQYVSLNNANLGGMKSSQYMTQQVNVAISTAGQMATYTVSLSRTHHGTGAWPDHRNDNLTRIVLPANATLVSATLDGQPASAVTIETVANRLATGFRIDTNPGTSRTLIATFTVPIDPDLSSNLVWQTQPGVSGDNVTVTYNGQTLIKGILNADTLVKLP